MTATRLSCVTSSRSSQSNTTNTSLSVEPMANHKRKRPKQRRAGCLMCKPNKLGKGQEKKLGHRGFGKLRGEYHAERDLKLV